MNTEVDYAVNFLVSTIKEKLSSMSEQQVQMLHTRLPELLHERYENHWYADKPMKGSAFRCINISVEDNSVDVVLRQAAEDSGINTKDLLNVFNKGLALWVDPNDVSCRLGKGAIFPIYKKIADNKKARMVSAPLNSITNQRRPQQRPRSASPPQTFNYSSSQQMQSRSRSTTPPGFSSMDAGKMFQAVPKTINYSTDLHKVWDSIPNTTTYTSSTHSPVSYASTSSPYGVVVNDSSYSFNQYSSYYNPNTTWKKNTHNQVRQQKPFWVEDHIYQRYHWSCNENENSTNNSFYNNGIQGYNTASNRRAQEVC